MQAQHLTAAELLGYRLLCILAELLQIIYNRHWSLKIFLEIIVRIAVLKFLSPSRKMRTTSERKYNFRTLTEVLSGQIFRNPPSL